VYWGVRKESAHQCAQRMSALLDCLAHRDPRLQRWLETGRSRKEALSREIEPKVEVLQDLLLRGRNRSDIGQQVMEELGFRASLWTTSSSGTEDASLMIKCGCYASRPGVNSCVLNLPRQWSNSADLQSDQLLRMVMECMVSAWAPDWGLVSSSLLDSARKYPKLNAPRVGWLTYLSAQRGVIPPLPVPAQVERLGSEGSLIIVTDELFATTSPNRAEAMDRIAALLDQAGLLGPLM
jgi:Immunity protein 52